MMDELTWPEWQEQLAYDDIENGPLETLAEILKLGFAGVCQSWGSELTTDHFEPDKWRKIGTPGVDADGYTSPDAQVAMLRSQIDAGK